MEDCSVGHWEVTAGVVVGTGVGTVVDRGYVGEGFDK
jgi:hypothetical protein